MNGFLFYQKQKTGFTGLFGFFIPGFRKKPGIPHPLRGGGYFLLVHSLCLTTYNCCLINYFEEN